jgi:hypothetical protein
MKSFAIMATILLVAANAHGALVLQNGTFDDDPDLGSADDPVNAPTGWYQHYTQEGSWSDFRFGNDFRGGWDDNAISLGQNFTPDAGPEDGYFYTHLGQYAGEISTAVDGFGYNRSDRANPAGNFVVALYSTPAGSFTAADNNDVAAIGRLLGETTVDISDLTGFTPQSRAFNLAVTFAGSGINAGDDLWLYVGDGPEDGNLITLDEPMIDNLTLTTVVPEPSALAVLLAASALLTRRQHRSEQ